METSPTFAANELLNVFKVKDGNKLMRSESDPIRNREIKNSISVVDDRWENSGNKGSGQIVYATSPVPFRDDMALPSSSSRVFGMSFPHFSNMSQPSPNSMSIASALSLLSSSLNYQGLCPQSTDRISSQFTIPGLTPSDKRSSGNKNVAISLTQSILEASGDSAKRGLKNSSFPDKENDSDAANSPSSGSTSPELDDGVEQTIDTHEKLIDPSMKDAEKHRRSITSVADFSSPPLYNRSRQTETHG